MPGTRPGMTNTDTEDEMGFKCGIVGLPNVGKSTLFNALTETAAAQAANYPFCTIEPNVGEVAVPDPRLDKLAEIAKSGQIIPTRLTFVDIAGLVRGASKGEGLGFGMRGRLPSKPVLYVCNVEEASAAKGNNFSRAVAEHASKEGAVAVTISAKIESEIATLSREERAEFLDTLGLEEAGLDRLIRVGYQLLDLITYFTVGPKEARAWTIHRGTKAPAAAGVIHTDFEKGFIRAETIAYDDYVALGGEAGARDAGKLRLEGKDYVVADGDVMHFRFAT